MNECTYAWQLKVCSFSWVCEIVLNSSNAVFFVMDITIFPEWQKHLQKQTKNLCISIV